MVPRTAALCAAGAVLCTGSAALARPSRDANAHIPSQAPANLLVNPGAEDAEGAADTTTQVPIPGWETTSTMTAMQYGTDTFPTAADAARIGGGGNFFAGGPGGARSTATQLVDVSASAAAIDAGRLAATLSAWLGGWSGQNDAIAIAAVYRSDAGESLGRTTIGPVLAADRGGVTGFRQRSATDVVPARTRSIQVVVTATRTEGTYNDGYADNLVLALGPAPVPVAGVSVNVTPVSGTVRVRLRGSNRVVSLARLRPVPVGSELDVPRGRVRLVSAAGGRRTQTGVFFQGRGTVRQNRGAAPVTTLQVTGPLVCPRRTTAQRPPPRVRRLWGDATGRFRTQGRYATASVRGTVWLTEDRCDGTFIRVRTGRVQIRDLVARRTVTIRAGQTYLARARR